GAEPDNRYLLKTKGLSISFGGLTAVDSVDLEVGRGTTVGLIGPNGSGKTTFFNIVSGIYRPSQGEVWFDGENIVGEKPHIITRKGMARTFQNNRLFWQLSILDNVILGMYSRQKARLFDVLFRYRRAREEIRECAERAVEILSYFSSELGSDYSRLVSDLSQGDRRRVEICRALASNPKLLLLDEPSAGMSPEETEKLMEDILRLRERYRDISIIIIEHDMMVIENIAQHVVVFNYGKKIAEGTFSEVTRNEEVLRAYLGEESEDARA
ncbi:MAG: ABC transporter ATP-binding protein, partial [Deltaproteobacteria bacterium]|nr:ABC transporter ATP-binding protein [Deltaproteobacteria bacterium]